MRSGDSFRLLAIDGSAVLTMVVSSICMNAAVATSQSIGRDVPIPLLSDRLQRTSVVGGFVPAFGEPSPL